MSYECLKMSSFLGPHGKGCKYLIIYEKTLLNKLNSIILSSVCDGK